MLQLIAQSKNCLACSRYLTCKESAKSAMYSCREFKETKSSRQDGVFRLFDKLGNTGYLPATAPEQMVQDIDRKKEFNVYKTIKRIIKEVKSDKVMSADLTLDGHDVPYAANFLQWCTGDKFLANSPKPFLEQVLLGIRALSEYCPKCSDMEWMDNTHKVDDSLKKLKRKIALLEFGVCPHCSKDKAYLFSKGYLNNYNEAAVCAGQRCVTGESLIFTQDGLMEIQEYSTNRPIGFSSMHLPVYNGESLETSSNFYLSEKEKVTTVLLKNGFYITGTDDHPIYTLQGFKRIANISTNDYVKVSIGSKIFGNKVVLLQDVLTLSDEEYTARRKTTASTNVHQIVHCQFRSTGPNHKNRLPISITTELCEFMGFWVAEGRGPSLGNSDKAVIDLVRSVFLRLVNSRYISEYKGKREKEGFTTIGLRGMRAECFLKALLGQDLHVGSARKVVPKIIRQGPKEYQTAFLRALFEGDGGLNGKDVSYCTLSKKLAYQVSAMLCNLGIFNRVGHMMTWATNGSENQVSKPAYVVVIQGKFLEKFEQEVGFFSKRKKKALRERVERHLNREVLMSFNYDKLPTPLKTEFIGFVKELKISLREFNQQFYTKRGTLVRNTRLTAGLETLLGKTNTKGDVKDTFSRLSEHNVPLTKKKLRILCKRIRNKVHYLSDKQQLTLKYYEDIANDENSFYVKVKNITISKKKRTTYDFTLPQTHAFWSNGLISHNSGKSEVVGMISTYLTHLQLMMTNPNRVYGLSDSNVLHGTFVATTYAQAKDTLWEPFYGRLLETPWFQNYHEILNQLSAKSGTGEEILKLKDTFVYYRHRRLLVYPAGPDVRTLRGRTRFFACLTGDSLVSTSKGLIPMKDSSLVGSFTHRGSSERKITKHAFTGIKDVWKVQLKNGLQLKTTSNHQFLCLSDDSQQLIWKRQDELSLGDVVAASLGGEFPKSLPLSFKYISRDLVDWNVRLNFMLANASGFTTEELRKTCGKTRLPELKKYCPTAFSRTRVGRTSPFVYSIIDTDALKDGVHRILNSGKAKKARNSLNFPTKMTVELSYLIGYLIADGNYAQNGTEITFTSTSKKKVRHFYDCFSSSFNVQPRISSWKTENGRAAYNVVFALQELKDFFVYLGLNPAWSSIKTIPWSILQAPRDCVAACLSSMVSCDGSIKGQRLSYSSKSKKLIRHVQLLFMRLGYACTSKFGAISQVNLTAFDRDAFLLNDYTGLKKRGYHKKSKANNLKHSLTHKNYTIPGARSTNVNRSWEDCNVFTKSELNSRCADTSLYSNLIDTGLVFSTVKAIKYVGKKKVYDISVDSEDHTFTANGVAVHNSIDEIAYFDNTKTSKVKMNAKGVYQALERSLLTVRAKSERLLKRGIVVPSAYFFNISSPTSQRDMIMELLRKSQGSKKMLGLIKPTWEMNPDVPRSALDEEFRKDPERSMCDYGCEPPLTSNPFISNTSTVDQCFTDKKNPIRIIFAQKKAKDQSLSRYAYVDKIKKSGKPSVLTLDAGYSNNSFAAVVAHLEDHKYPKIDLMVEVMPLPGIPLNYSLIYSQLLGELIDERNVVLCAADRWNSLKILSDMEEEFEIDTRQYSLKYQDMQVFKSYAQDKQLLYPKPGATIDEILAYDPSDYPNCFKHKPIEHFVLQMLTVQDTGSSVIKGENLTDDLVRASMLAVTMLLDPANEEIFAQEEKAIQSRVNIADVAVYKGGSGGTSSKNGGQVGNVSPQAMGILKRGS